MGLTEAMASAFVAFLTVLCPFIAVWYFWQRRARRFNDEVALDCARKSGGSEAVQLIREENRVLADVTNSS